MTSAGGSTLRRRRLGSELRKLREKAGRTHQEIAQFLECSQAKISKIETGRLGMRAVELSAVLDFLDAPEDEIPALLALARESRQTGWWKKYDDAITSKFADYVALEGEATEVRIYQAEVIPGLLQTEDYARAVNRVTRWRDNVDLDRDTEVRMERQRRVLEGELQLHAILNEGAIRRAVGRTAVMRDQLRHLLEMAHQPHIMLQVLAFYSGEHMAMTGPFVVARFADRETDPDVVYLENQTGGLFLENREEVERYNDTFGRLIADALDPGRSAKLIGKVLNELSDTAPIPY